MMTMIIVPSGCSTSLEQASHPADMPDRARVAARNRASPPLASHASGQHDCRSWHQFVGFTTSRHKAGTFQATLQARRNQNHTLSSTPIATSQGSDHDCRNDPSNTMARRNRARVLLDS
jgi:hypothetical protein